MPIAIVVTLAVIATAGATAIAYLLLDWRYRVRFEQWKNEYGREVAAAAIKGSQAAISGRVLEKFAPIAPGFDFNPRDARFIGDPVDFVIFDGLSEGQVRGVVFLEVKSGAGGLNANERRVREVIAERRVQWQLFQLPDVPEERED